MSVRSFVRRQPCRDHFVCSPQRRGYVRGAGLNGVELSMPRCLRQDETRPRVVVELIGGDVNSHPPQFKPNMGLLTAIARDTLSARQSLPKQVLGEQQRGIVACAAGEMLKSDRKVARIALLDRATKGSRQRFYFVRLKVWEGVEHLLFLGQLRKEAA